ncbi:hypothetical protein [Kitasatospora sp. GAS204B]|uniref:hypothetical protein n=1 Tax=unclassified Kitasatospora TaxID=2633591 RepID=UPI0024749E7D|nr:hypothetical protein [Kitasatospora sp. GAS204B]MDH6122826.1 hypothetical protein [Kitasatospora sp. GAS204B]
MVETAVPGASSLSLERQQTIVREVGHEHLKISAVAHDPYAQHLTSQEIRMGADGRYQMLPIVRRNAHLPKLDLMARVTGLRLAQASRPQRTRAAAQPRG